MPNDSIELCIKQMDDQTKAIKSDILRYCWLMRGSISYNEAMQLSPYDRQTIDKLTKDNLEITKKTGIPFF